MNDAHKHYRLISQAIELIMNAEHELSLNDLASALNQSPSYLQKNFTAWAGISPKQFTQVLRHNKAKALLNKPTHSVLDTAETLALSSPSRLYDTSLRIDSMTPGEIKQQGAGLHIEYGHSACLFGYAFLAFTPRGLCKLSFYTHANEAPALLQELKHDWPKATLQENNTAAENLCTQIFAPSIKQQDIKLLLKGSPFQLQVWQALLHIPEGSISSYGQLAQRMQQPKATRAVASAIAKNPIAYLIPCHRVIRASGAINQYRWGSERKVAMLAHEKVLQKSSRY